MAIFNSYVSLPEGNNHDPFLGPHVPLCTPLGSHPNPWAPPESLPFWKPPTVHHCTASRTPQGLWKCFNHDCSGTPTMISWVYWKKLNRPVTLATSYPAIHPQLAKGHRRFGVHKSCWECLVRVGKRSKELPLISDVPRTPKWSWGHGKIPNNFRKCSKIYGDWHLRVLDLDLLPTKKKSL